MPLALSLEHCRGSPADYPTVSMVCFTLAAVGLVYYMGWSRLPQVSVVGLNELYALTLRTPVPLVTFPVFMVAALARGAVAGAVGVWQRLLRG